MGAGQAQALVQVESKVMKRPAEILGLEQGSLGRRGKRIWERVQDCIFSLQFEMLTGSLPFQGKDRKETMTLILK